LRLLGRRFGPEAVELQFAPQDAGEPARAPLARPAETHLVEAQTDHVAAFDERATIFGEQRQSPRPASVLVEHLDRLAPGFSLGRIDLAKVEDMALHHPAAVEPPVLDDAPVEMRLPVLASFGLPQKHGERHCDTEGRVEESCSRKLGLHYSRFWRSFL